ncbi:MAG: tRNA (N6-isopentenyl adenosine(37)-C2)-methylthiotransferase MiaB [Chitinispirillaceae bacterium]|nr:tRNA (N6-isopentenyl adenosine(37)-C2)-methylthiotransferase MiaB [Chitinispirillaceae bacterium]
MPYVYFQTFGCQMNVADSNDIGERLFTHGFRSSDDPAKADLIVVNTCSVREHAEQRAKTRIGEYGRLKKQEAQLWVIGCMAERLGESLKREIPEVDRVIGARSLEGIDEVISSVFPDQNVDFKGIEATDEASEFVSVIRGCDNYCTYCIVPYVRGPEASIPAAIIIDTIRKKAGRGVKEVTLLGQNVNSYCDAGIDFPDLIRAVAAVEGIKRIRFTTSHPKDCSEKLIRTIADEPKCCRHVHLPVQAGADRILSLMNRRYTAADYRDRISMIRSLLPDADITTDILVGFPSETDAEFESTLALVEEVRFTAAFMFAYSIREGTAAASMSDTVSHELKHRRLKQLIDVQTAITREIYTGMAGRKVRLMISGRQEKRDRLWMARDYGCKRALIACDEVPAGTILQADVVRTSGMTLICERTAL